MSCCICVNICIKIQSADWTQAGFKDEPYISWLCWYPDWRRLGWLAFLFYLPLVGHLPAAGKNDFGLAIMVIWNSVDSVFDICGGFLFLCLNCLMISVKKYFASSFFTLCLGCRSISLFSNVTCEANAFSNLTILFLMSATGCFVLYLVIAIHCWVNEEHAHLVKCVLHIPLQWGYELA